MLPVADFPESRSVMIKSTSVSSKVSEHVWRDLSDGTS